MRPDDTLSCAFKLLQGSGDRHGPRRGAGAEPLLNGAFSQSKFSQKICATRTKPPRRGDLGRAAARLARLCCGKCLGKKPELSEIQLFVRYMARNGFFSNPPNFCPLPVGLPPSSSAPAGRFGRAAPICCANGLPGKRARHMQGLCPCTPPGTVTVPGPLQLLKDKKNRAIGLCSPASTPVVADTP